MDSNTGGRYVVVGSDGRIIQKYQYFVASSASPSQHLPVMTINPNCRIIPVRDKIQSSSSAISSAALNEVVINVKPDEVENEIQQNNQLEKEHFQSEEQHRDMINEEISTQQKKVRGDREVECAKSCRACCNIDDSDYDGNKQRNVQANVAAARTWGCARCGPADVVEPSSSNVAGEEKSPNSIPLVLGLVPASNVKMETTAKGRFQCKVCFKLFTQKVNLTTHERIHLGERPYQCKVCQKAFTQQSNLVTHERIHTGERPYQCQVCLKRFTQRQNLTAHERIHLGERPFQCQICQKAFTQRQNLVAHERIHLGERPYQCQLCMKSFTQQQNLTAHERIHTGFRQFSCSVCQKSFTQEQNLTKHMLTHTGEKSFPCRVYGKSFTQQSNLTTHEQTHTEEVLEESDRKRKVFVYSQEQLITPQMETQQSETEVAQTDMSSVYPTQGSQ